MKIRCYKCGMIRSNKDLVKIESGDYICFACWNRELTDKENSLQK